MNKVILCGRLTRDPEIRYSQGNNPTAIARGSIAVDRKYKQDGQPTADFINILAFGKTAGVFEKYVRKGTKIIIEGRIQTGSYTNKDGNKVYTTDVLVESIEFAGSRQSSENSGYNNTQRSDLQQTDSNGFMNIPEGIDEELPFN